MNKIVHILVLSQLLTISALRAVTIEVENSTNKTIRVSLYEAVEEQSLLGEPELEAQSEYIKPGKTEFIRAELDTGTYELEASNKGDNILKVTPRSLSILINSNDNHLRVRVTKDTISYAHAEGCLQKNTPQNKSHRRSSY
jgi:hypothetical protein